MTTEVFYKTITENYQSCLQNMQSFTNFRDENTTDEIWFTTHDPIFTLGQNAKPQHILTSSPIPIVNIDRGGQVTYHGPGQLMIYTLIDLKRKQWTIREFVCRLENIVIAFLNDYDKKAQAKRDAPGVYVGEKKICSIGLRVRKGRAYHGLALNVDMDLTPFSYINPCGYENLEMTKLHDLNILLSLEETKKKIIPHIQTILEYNTVTCRD